jgi:hypothetical protein
MFAALCAPYLVCVYTGLPGSHTPIPFGAA